MFTELQRNLQDIGIDKAQYFSSWNGSRISEAFLPLRQVGQNQDSL